MYTRTHAHTHARARTCVDKFIFMEIYLCRLMKALVKLEKRRRADIK